MVNSTNKSILLRMFAYAAVFAVIILMLLDASLPKALVLGILFGLVMTLLDRLPALKLDEQKTRRRVDDAEADIKKDSRKKKSGIKIVR